MNDRYEVELILFRVYKKLAYSSQVLDEHLTSSLLKIRINYRSTKVLALFKVHLGFRTHQEQILLPPIARQHHSSRIQLHPQILKKCPHNTSNLNPLQTLPSLHQHWQQDSSEVLGNISQHIFVDRLQSSIYIRRHRFATTTASTSRMPQYRDALWKRLSIHAYKVEDE